MTTKRNPRKQPERKDDPGRGGDAPASPGDAGEGPASSQEAVGTESLTGVPDFLRRAMAIGLSGFFTTETALRKALGDTVPQDWLDFAAEQSDRTQKELYDRLSAEFGRVLDNVDFVQFAEALLEGRTLEVEARIKLGPKAEGKPDAAENRVRISIESDTVDSDV